MALDRGWSSWALVPSLRAASGVFERECAPHRRRPSVAGVSNKGGLMPTAISPRIRRLSGRDDRLKQLLERRDALGRSWAERASHGLPGLGDLTIDLLVVENSLAERWPYLSERWMREWVVADANKLHDPESDPRRSCAICVGLRAGATAS